MKQSAARFVVMLLMLPILLGAGELGVEGNSYQANRKRIEEMSLPNRNRLKRNFETFQKMSGEQQDYYRQFHQQVVKKNDQQQNEMQKSLRQYIDWLNTLNPLDRQNLREVKDPQKRILLVETLIQQQLRNQRRVYLAMATRFIDSKDPLRRRLANGPTIGQDDLIAVFDNLEKRIPLTEDLTEELAELKGAEKYAFLLYQMVRTARSSRGNFLKKSNNLKDLINSIADPVIRNEMAKTSIPEMHRQVQFSLLLLRSIFYFEMMQEVHLLEKEGTPTSQELEKFKSKHAKLFSKIPQQESVVLDDRFVLFLWTVKTKSSESVLSHSEIKQFLKRTPGERKPGRRIFPGGRPFQKGKGKGKENRPLPPK